MASEKEIHTLTIDVGNLLLFRKTKKNRAVFLLRGECPGGGGGGGGGGGVFLGIFGGSVPHASPNPDPISDQKLPFSTPVFRPDLA